jgi:hypothetical protein
LVRSLLQKNISHDFSIVGKSSYAGRNFVKGTKHNTIRGFADRKHKMSSRFSLQRPYVVATLPKPIDRRNGRYVVGDVYGGAPGLKKRKRSELVIGIDGEGVNIYDV